MLRENGDAGCCLKIVNRRMFSWKIEFGCWFIEVCLDLDFLDLGIYDGCYVKMLNRMMV